MRRCYGIKPPTVFAAFADAAGGMTGGSQKSPEKVPKGPKCELEKTCKP
ncbi:MAG: hypothetical protein VB109_13625 [Desulfitobacterium hafniense]|nr:hypothetical protein [Desulfitobacterium hafniense]MEA5023871.1 hypothetical protein [Desulfitobacterium hafniense]